MPTYEYQCDTCGVVQEAYRKVEDRDSAPWCHGPMVKIISRVMGFVQPDICYDSPIDGRPITSMKARLEDLARSNCVPYDPEIKKDYQRRIEREEKALDSAVDETIDREIATMPIRKREKLAAEMEGGMGLDYARTTPTSAELR